MDCPLGWCALWNSLKLLSTNCHLSYFSARARWWLTKGFKTLEQIQVFFNLLPPPFAEINGPFLSAAGGSDVVNVGNDFQSYTNKVLLCQDANSYWTSLVAPLSFLFLMCFSLIKVIIAQPTRLFFNFIFFYLCPGCCERKYRTLSFGTTGKAVLSWYTKNVSLESARLHKWQLKCRFISPFISIFWWSAYGLIRYDEFYLFSS